MGRHRDRTEGQVLYADQSGTQTAHNRRRELGSALTGDREGEKSGLRKVPMEWINLAASRLRALFHRERILQDTEAELRSHIELEMESNIKCGMRPEEARAAALSSFGNLGRACDLAHEIRGAGWMDEI